MTVYVWAILAGSAVGLLASTMGRLYASTFWALHDTRTPLRTASIRVCLTIGLATSLRFRSQGLWASRPDGERQGSPPRPASRDGSSSSCFGGPSTGVSGGQACRCRSRPGSGEARRSRRLPDWALRLILPVQHPVILAIFLLGAYGVVYLALTAGLGVAEAGGLLRRLKR